MFSQPKRGFDSKSSTRERRYSKSSTRERRYSKSSTRERTYSKSSTRDLRYSKSSSSKHVAGARCEHAAKEWISPFFFPFLQPHKLDQVGVTSYTDEDTDRGSSVGVFVKSEL